MRTTISFDFGRFAIALTIIFIGLKILDVISWSWWWIFSPVIILILITLFIIIPIMRYVSKKQSEIDKISEDINKAIKKQKDEKYR